MHITDLPTEILVQILSDPELDYVTLKLVVQSVCRRFRDVVKYTSTQELSETLFRDRPNDIHRTEEGCTLKYHLHPCFSNIRLREPSSTSRDVAVDIETIFSYIDGIDSFGFCTSTDRFVPITKTDVANENATSPATDILVFSDPDSTDYDDWMGANTLPEPIDHRRTGDPVTVIEVLNSQAKAIRECFKRAEHIYYEVNKTYFFVDGRVFPISTIPTKCDWPGPTHHWMVDAFNIELLTKGKGKGMVLSKLRHGLENVLKGLVASGECID